MALAMVAAAFSGCKKKNTYVHLQILPAANEPAGIIDKIDLQMTLGGQSQSTSLAEGGAPLALPTSVTLEIIGSGSGQLAITAVATNVEGAEVDRGVTTVEVKSQAITEATIQLPGGKPVILSNEAQHNFLTVTAGQSAPATITFHNSGFQPSGAITMAVGGVGAAQFSITADTCTGVHLAPGASCTVTLAFHPVSSGDLAAALTLSATPAVNTVVTLIGTGSPNPQTLSVALKGTGQGSVS